MTNHVRNANLRHVFSLTGLIAVGMLLGFGCSQAENALNCNDICDRYKECFDQSYDTTACRQRCSDSANNDPDQMAKVTKCSDCIGDKSCAGAAFTCATECAGIVP